MHVPRAERAARWRAYAQADREAAQRLATDLWHVSCFHAQQASEKALKAMLTQIQGDVVPTHVAQVLLGALAELGEPAPPDVVAAANALCLDARNLGRLCTIAAKRRKTPVLRSNDGREATMHVGPRAP